jgi:hypothetical protein
MENEKVDFIIDISTWAQNIDFWHNYHTDIVIQLLFEEGHFFQLLFLLISLNDHIWKLKKFRTVC